MKTVNFLLAILAFAFTTSTANAQFEQADNKADFALISNGNLDETPANRTNATGAKVVSTFQEGIAITELNGKFGFVNRFGNEIVFPKYQEARFFQNGYAAVKTNTGWTFINKQGQRIAPARYTWVGTFQANGLALVQIDGLWGFINEQGQEVTPVKYERIRAVGPNGQTVAKYKNQWFILDEMGRETPAPLTLQAQAQDLIRS